MKLRKVLVQVLTNLHVPLAIVSVLVIATSCAISFVSIHLYMSVWEEFNPTGHLSNHFANALKFHREYHTLIKHAN